MHASPTRAFSILEILVIVVLALTMAVVVTPRFASAGDRALRESMQQQVIVLNQAVEAYRRDNAGVTPRLGGKGADGWAALIQGGYIANAPVNAYLGATAIVSTRAAPDLIEPGETREGAEIGWFYHPLSGRIIANGFDHERMLFHDEPGYDTKSLGW
jgi:type II secretory pathway pseudopilin PulG